MHVVLSTKPILSRGMGVPPMRLCMHLHDQSTPGTTLLRGMGVPPMRVAMHGRDAHATPDQFPPPARLQ